METIASLKIASDLENLASIRSFIDKASKEIGLSDEALSEIRLAVDEACSNIMIHGYKDSNGELEIVVDRGETSMVVTLSDNAPTFNPLQASDHPDFGSPLEERPLGGMGVFLVKQNTDTVEYRATPSGGNALILTKNF